MRRRILSALLWVALAPVACGDNDSTTKLATFNAGLAPGFEQYVPERKPAIQSALVAQARDIDVLCVQEYFDEGHWQDLAAAAVAELPYALRRAPEPGPASCTAAELDPLMACLDAECPGLIGDELAACALAKCAEEVGALSAGCLACVTQDLTLPLEQIYQACISGTSTGSEDTPAIYGGVFDVGLLSRHPFLAQDSKRLDAFMVRVSVLYGKIATDAGELHVFCTHLTSEIGDWEYGGTHGSWRAENMFEAQQLVDWVNEKVADGDTAVILGDLNTCVAVGTIQAERPESFEVLTGAAFSDPFLAQADVRCTSCPDNTQKSPDSSPTLIDHVLLRGFSGKATVARMLDTPVTVDVNGAPMSINLSDHYGLIATLSN